MRILRLRISRKRRLLRRGKRPSPLKRSEPFLRKRVEPDIPSKFGNCSKSTAPGSCRRSTLQNIRHYLQKLRCWEMGKHALLSASSSHRWLNCPPSARISESFEDKGSNYAA